MKNWVKHKVIDFCYVTDFVANGSFASLRENVTYINSPEYAVLVRLTDFTKKWSKDFVYVSKDSYDFLKKSSLLPNDLIMSNVGEPGIVFLVPDLGKPMTLGPNSILIRPDFKKSTSNFLHYYFSSDIGKKQIDEISTGAAQKKFNKTSFRELEILLPLLPEQQRIVSILDKAFAALAKAKANAEQNLKNAQELFKSYLQGVFENGNWEKKELREITSILGDGLHGTPKYTVQGDYYFINGNNLIDGKIELKESTKRVNFSEFNKHKKNLTNRTIFVSINGTLGNVAFYNGEKVILGKSACYFNLKENVDKGFVKYVILSPYFINYIQREATGATIKNVSLKSMREFKVPIPTLKEQQSIVLQLDALRKETKKLEAIYQKKIEDLEELKKSILQKAFAGEL